MHFGDLSTFDTRKVHLSTIPSLTARACDLSTGSNASVAGPLGDLPPFETKDLQKPRSHVWNVASTERTLDSLLSRQIERASRVLFPFFFRTSVSLSFVARCSIGCVFYFGVERFLPDTRFLYDTLEQHLVVHGNRRNRNFNESKTSVLHEEPRNGRLSRAFRYREVWKGCEETQACPFREP